MEHEQRDARFEAIITRRQTESIKWTLYDKDVLPVWVADMDFSCASPVPDRAEHGIYVPTDCLPRRRAHRQQGTPIPPRPKRGQAPRQSQRRMTLLLRVASSSATSTG